MKKLSQKKFFDFGLYVEGLRKVRVPGIVASILSLVFCAIVPIIHMISSSGRTRQIVTVQNFAIPLLLMMPMALVFVLSMFSFLNKRNESDFYHSIPYTRLCVYFSFMAAILTWIWGIVTVTTLFTGFLWAIDVHAALNASCLVLVPLAYFIMTLFLVGIMTVAMMLTGTSANNLAIGMLFLFFVRAVGAMVTFCMNSAVRIFDMSYSFGAFLQAKFFMPFAIVEMHITGNVASFYGNYAMFIYTLVVGILLIGVGAVLYHYRRSEIAGQNAPNKILHHIFRCMVTLPFALLLTSFCLAEGYSGGYMDGGVFVLLLALTLLVNYLYELILTKSWKRTVRTTPFLAAILAVCLIYAGGIAAARSYILSHVPDKDDIAAIRLYDTQFYYGCPYETWRTAEVASSNAEAIELVAKALDYAAELNINDEYDWDKQEQNVEITLKSGRKIGRVVVISEGDLATVQKKFIEEPAYAEAYLPLPKESEIGYLYLYGIDNYRRYDEWDDSVYTEEDPSDTMATAMKIWRVFAEEYETLTTEQKYRVKSAGYSENLIFEVEGTYRGNRFANRYAVLPEMKKTIAKIEELFSDETDRKVTAEYLDTVIGAYEAGEERVYDQLSFECQCLDGFFDNYSAYLYVWNSKEVGEEIHAMLKSLREDLSDPSRVTANGHLIVINSDLTSGKEYYAGISCVLRVSEETWAGLNRIQTMIY